MVDVHCLLPHYADRYCYSEFDLLLHFSADAEKGIGIHESFNLNGRSALLAIGILDSISAGILLYSE